MDKLGPTGHRVGQRLRALRLERGYTLGDLEAKLVDVGRPILLSALSKIEKGQRRVDVDDLVALALALDVSPNLLLLPGPFSSGTEIALTESRALPPAAAWSWATKDRPPPASARTIFISYSHHDKNWATWVAGCLAEAGYEVAIDSWDVAPGMDIRTYLVDRINQAAAVVVIVTENFTNSSWTSFELDLAMSKELPVLPMTIDDATPDNRILSDHVRLDVGSEIEAKKKLLAAVREMGIRSRPATAKPTFPSVRPRSFAAPLPRHRMVVACDIERSTSWTSPVRAAVRADMFDLLETTLLACGITEELREPLLDRGDGAIVILRPSDQVPTASLLSTWVPAMEAALVEHAALHPDREFLLRVAIHSGDVHFDSRGVFGEDIDLTVRLLDARALKRLPQRTGARLRLAVSDHIYRTVVRHGYDGINPHAFMAFEIRMGGQTHRGWFTAPKESTSLATPQPGISQLS